MNPEHQITYISIDGTQWYVYNPNYYPDFMGCPVIEKTATEEEAKQFIQDGYNRTDNVIQFPGRKK